MTDAESPSDKSKEPEKKSAEAKTGGGIRLLRRVLAWLVVALAAGGGIGWYVGTRKPPLVIPEGGGVSDWPAYGRAAGGSRYAPLT